VADEKDDLLNPEDVEKLLNSAGKEDPPSEGDLSQTGESSDKDSGESGGGPGELLDPNEIEALLKKQESASPDTETPNTAASTPADQTVQQTEALLEKAEADLAAAVAPDLALPPGIPPELGTPKPFDFKEFQNDTGTDLPKFGLKSLEDVELDLRIELGRTELLIEEVLALKEGSVVPLDKLAGDPVDILVNGRLVARGEVLVLNDNFCVRVAEILTPHF